MVRIGHERKAGRAEQFRVALQYIEREIAREQHALHMHGHACVVVHRHARLTAACNQARVARGGEFTWTKRHGRFALGTLARTCTMPWRRGAQYIGSAATLVAAISS